VPKANLRITWILVGGGIALALVVVVVKLATTTSAAADCIILTNGGNKLCDEDAAAWCRSTDGIREAARGSGNEAVDETLQSSQQACDEIRSVSGEDAAQTPPDLEPAATTVTAKSPPPPRAQIGIYKPVQGADRDDLSDDSVAVLYDTRRRHVRITGWVKPWSATLLMSRGRIHAKGWQAPTTVDVQPNGDFTVTVSLERGENDLRFSAAHSGIRRGEILVAVTRH
jgi:hypothetical protein